MSEDEDKKAKTSLEWRDYIALTVAALETVLLPLVIVAVVLIVLYLILR